ncbi:MAG TPA: hypothetical protein PLO27_06725, partial [Marmoricola sp.]|nr:hypothetical protein [Marmoricola sp.]
MKKRRVCILLVSMVLMITGFSGPGFAASTSDASSSVGIRADSGVVVVHADRKKGKKRKARHHRRSRLRCRNARAPR